MAEDKPLSLSGSDVTVRPFHTEWPTAELVQWSKRQPHPPDPVLSFLLFHQEQRGNDAGQSRERQCGTAGGMLGLPSGILIGDSPCGQNLEYSTPDSLWLPTALRINPQFLAMFLHDPSHWPPLLPLLCVAHWPPAFPPNSYTLRAF